MHFDALCLACITCELQRDLCPGRVQQVVMEAPRSLALEVYAHGRRQSLLLHAEPADARLHLVQGKVRRGVEGVTPLLLLLRKYVRDAFLVAVRQPALYERVLELEFEHREHGPTCLIVEMIGRTPNVVLCDGRRVILDCMQRVTGSQSGGRTLLPGNAYVLPHQLTRIPPLDDGSPDYYQRLQALTQMEGPLWKALVSEMCGISPSQAREIAFRARGDAFAPATGTSVVPLAQALQELWQPASRGECSPHMWTASDGSVGYAAYLPQLAEMVSPAATLSEAIETVLALRQQTRLSERDSYAESRRVVLRMLQQASGRVTRQWQALANDEPEPGEADTLRTQAEWLLALHTRIADGQRTLEVDTGSETLRIELESDRSPVEQAQAMFRRAAKSERAIRAIAERRVKLRADFDFLAQLESDLSLAQDQSEIAAVRRDLEASGLTPHKKGARPSVAQPRSAPRVYRTPDGARILVGRSASQNDRVTFEMARPEDYWLHVRGAPGSHVIVQSGGGSTSDSDLEAAAQLAAYYSSQRGETSVDVIITRRKWVQRVAGGRPGQVTVRHEEVLRVAARLPEVVQLDEKPGR
jgi:predicted ribosome quality control (RQC) complex YloA/Tae2 family protein